MLVIACDFNTYRLAELVGNELLLLFQILK